MNDPEHSKLRVQLTGRRQRDGGDLREEQTMSLNLADLLSAGQPILYSQICSSLSAVDIINLSLTCKAAAHLRHSLYNINSHIKRFSRNPLEFRSMMAKCNAIVSGSDALQFFRRCRWDDADLDVYIGEDKDLSVFTKYLVEREGFEFKPYSWQPADLEEAIVARRMGAEEVEALDDEANDARAWLYSMKYITGVFDFFRPGQSLKVQVITTLFNNPLRAILSGFYGTHILNFYTWNAAFSLFPLLTFNRNLSLVTRDFDDKLDDCVRKYQLRGFEFLGRMYPEQLTANTPVRNHRRVGDKYSWVMKFDVSGVELHPKAIPISVFEYGTFKIMWTSSRRDVPYRHAGRRMEYNDYYSIEASEFVNPLLGHEYLFGINDWMEFWGARLSQIAFYERLKFENTELQNIDMYYKARWPSPKPAGFYYRDTQVPDWYAAWSKTDSGREALDSPISHKYTHDYV